MKLAAIALAARGQQDWDFVKAPPAMLFTFGRLRLRKTCRATQCLSHRHRKESVSFNFGCQRRTAEASGFKFPLCSIQVSQNTGIFMHIEFDSHTYVSGHIRDVRSDMRQAGILLATCPLTKLNNVFACRAHTAIPIKPLAWIRDAPCWAAKDPTELYQIQFKSMFGVQLVEAQLQPNGTKGACL